MYIVDRGGTTKNFDLLTWPNDIENIFYPTIAGTHSFKYTWNSYQNRLYSGP